MPLTTQQLQEFKRKIVTRREILLDEIHAEVERTRERTYWEMAGPAPDSGDESVAVLLLDLDNAEVTRDVGELRQLDVALTRIADGSYGDCIDCGREISPERLSAVLSARRCIDCQSMYEKTFAQAAGPRL